jgi:hypothetical protein
MWSANVNPLIYIKRVVVQCVVHDELEDIRNVLERYEMKFDEFAANLTTLAGKIQKIGAETDLLLVKITELGDALANADNVPQNVIDAFDAAAAQADVVDAKVDDAPVEEPPVE